MSSVQQNQPSCSTGNASMENFEFRPDWAILDVISEELEFDRAAIRRTIEMLELEQTIPFIARYRKEKTNNMEVNQLRDVERLLQELKEVQAKAKYVAKSIHTKGKLTAALLADLEKATTVSEIELVVETQIGHIEMDSLQVRQSDKRYECVFKVHWLDGSISTVCKTHAQLFDFQGKVLQLFPETNEERKIPYIPGKHIFSGAQARDATEKLIPKEFQEYVRKLSALPKNILHCELMRDFFKEEFSLEGNVEVAAENVRTTTTPTLSASGDANSSLTTASIPIQEPEPEEPSENLPAGEQVNTPGQQKLSPQPVQGMLVAVPSSPQAHPVSPIPHQSSHPLTASLQHLEISHHQNVNLTPSNPFPHMGPSLAVNQLTGIAQLPLPQLASNTAVETTMAPPSESNSVYFQSISSAISIPTPTDMYTTPSASGDNLNQQLQDSTLVVKAQGSPRISSPVHAAPLPSEAYSPRTSDGAPSNGGDVSPPAMPVTPVAHHPPPPLSHLQQLQPMLCYGAPTNQPLTALPKSNTVAPEVQDWLKQQRLHKYEHFFEGLSIKQVIELTDEDIDKWESITEGAKGRFKGHFEQLRQSLLQNGLNTLPEPPHPVPPALTFLHPMAPQYYMIPPGMVLTQPFPVAPPQECLMRSDNSSSGSAGSRESSDECERDSENEQGSFSSQDARAQCNLQPKRRHAPHGPRHQHGRMRQGLNKQHLVGKPMYLPLIYPQVLKSPGMLPRNVSQGVPPKGPPSGSPIHLGQHHHMMMNNASNLVPANLPHTILIPPRVETPSAIETDGTPRLVSQGPPTKGGPGQRQNVGSQSNIARTQMSPLPPHMQGQTGVGWHPGSVMMPGGQVTSMPPLLTSPGVQLDQYSHSPTPQQRMEGPHQPPPPLVQIKTSRHAPIISNNHYPGEEHVCYRTFIPPPSVQVNSPSISAASSESTAQGLASPGIQSEGNFVVSTPGPTIQNNPKSVGVYAISQSQPGSASPVPSSHVPGENFGGTSTTTYVQAANQNTVSVVTTGLGMMHLAYSNPMVLAQSSGPCACNNKTASIGGNSMNQTCSLHQGQQNPTALLPTPTSYLSYQGFLQSPYIHPVNLMKGANSPRYVSPFQAPSVPAEMLYGGHYGATAPGQQQQVYLNQMGIRPHITGPHSATGAEGGSSGRKHPLNCFNCGKQGHKAIECREVTMESITQKCQYRLNYKPESTDS